MKLKATKEQTRKKRRQKLIDTNNSMVVTRRKWVGLVKGKGGQMYLTLGGGHTVQCTQDVS